MIAHTLPQCDRQTRLHFSQGELVGDMHTFTTTNFRTGVTVHHQPPEEAGNHGGGDLGLIRTFVEAVATKNQKVLGTDASDALRSHVIVFAAEEARRKGIVVDCVQFEKEAKETYAT